MSKKATGLRKITFDQYGIITKNPTYEELKACLDDFIKKQEKSLEAGLNNHSQYIRQIKINDLKKAIENLKKVLQN